MKIRSFKKVMKRMKMFVKKNIYGFAIGFCVLVGVTMVVVTLVTSKQNTSIVQIVEKNNNEVVPPLEEGNNSEVISPIEDNNVPVVQIPEETTVPVSTDTNVVFQMPVENYTLGLEYAENNLLYSKTLNVWQTHLGIDFLAESGTDVLCVYDGRVESIDYTVMDGTVVVIDHGAGLKSVYKSLDSNINITQGVDIKKGDKIGTVSTSSISEQSEGAHLHFEVIFEGKNVNPMEFLPVINK